MISALKKAQNKSSIFVCTFFDLYGIMKNQTSALQFRLIHIRNQIIWISDGLVNFLCSNNAENALLSVVFDECCNIGKTCFECRIKKYEQRVKV